MKKVFLLLLFSICFFCCKNKPAGQAGRNENHKPRIGLLMETLKEERWNNDLKFFKAKAESLGAEVFVASCSGDEKLQIDQAEQMLIRGVDILVVVPHDGKSCATIVNMAHQKGVRVIAYDRMILDCDLDLYISFDNYKIGQMQAQYAIDKAPEGNYILIEGAKTDNNAKLYLDGQMSVLQKFIDEKKINIISEQWADGWQPSEAMKHVENALTKTTDIAAVVCANDGTAGGSIQALAEKNLTGKVIVTGQDADLAACQRIADGTQSMTIYKPIQALAEAAAVAALQIIKNETVTDATQMQNNGKMDVPAILLPPVTVDLKNMMEVVIKSGYQKQSEVYDNLPR